MARRICDFCLEEGKGLLHQPEKLPDGHFLCKKCRRIIESYGLKPKYDLFQLLVTAQPEMRDMMMGGYLDSHKPLDAIAKYFPIPNIPLHEGEHCINLRAASISVSASAVPTDFAVTRVTDITKKEISNLPDSRPGGNSITVEGTLMETDAALYFLSEHFINCHRLISIITDPVDRQAIHVLEHGKSYTYATPNADLFLLRSKFYHMAINAAENKNRSLIYLASENTMTLTPGQYSVPKNIKSGTYYVNPVEKGSLFIRDANGQIRKVKPGRVRIDDGSVLEVKGEYEVRYNQRTPEDSNS